jgi:hypothetical protein
MNNVKEWRWAGPDLNRRPLARKAPTLCFEEDDQLLESFRDYQIVDLRRSKKTAYEKVCSSESYLGCTKLQLQIGYFL